MHKHQIKYRNLFCIVKYTLFLFMQIENKLGLSDIRSSVQAIFRYPNKFVPIDFLLLSHCVDITILLLPLA